MPLRDYQTDLYNETRQALREGYNMPLIVLPTGGGKGEIISQLVHDADAKGSHGIFLVDRQEIVKGQSEKLTRWGIPHGILMGNQSRDKYAPTMVGSVATCRQRLSEMRRFQYAICDEADGCVSEGWAKVFEALGNVPKIGFTATPWRLDRAGMKRAGFNKLILGPSVRELMDAGWLVDYELYAPGLPDLSELGNHGGDYTDAELSAVMDTSRIIGETVEQYALLGRGRPGVGFFVNRKHAEHQAEKFRAEGFRCIAVDANTKGRDKVWKDLANGTLDYVCSVGIISVGWDCPPVSYASLCRPTKSLRLYLQQVGRVLRTADGKQNAVIVDHAGNWFRHGKPDQYHEWTLEDRTKRYTGPCDMPEQLQPRVCPEPACGYLNSAAAHVCKKCGYQFIMPSEVEIEHKPGTLSLVAKDDIYGSGYDTWLTRASGDPALTEVVRMAIRKKWKPAAIGMKWQMIHGARQKFINIFGEEANKRWTVTQLNDMIAKYQPRG